MIIDEDIAILWLNRIINDDNDDVDDDSIAQSSLWQGCLVHFWRPENAKKSKLKISKNYLKITWNESQKSN